MTPKLNGARLVQWMVQGFIEITSQMCCCRKTRRDMMWFNWRRLRSSTKRTSQKSNIKPDPVHVDKKQERVTGHSTVQQWGGVYLQWFHVSILLQRRRRSKKSRVGERRRATGRGASNSKRNAFFLSWRVGRVDSSSNRPKSVFEWWCVMKYRRMKSPK